MEFAPGEIHCLCGENGSGKSTLVKLLTSVHHADEGRFWLWDRYVKHPWQPEHHGMAVIYQDLALVDSLTVLENFGIAAGYGVARRLPWVNWRREARLLRSYLERFGLSLDPGDRVADIRPSDRAMLAIVRALRQLDSEKGLPHRLLILDEPTVYLPTDEKERLATVMRNVAAEGVSVVLISHELDYVVSVADRLTVIRDGAVVSTFPAREARKAEIIRLMLGKTLDRFYPAREDRPASGSLLSARKLSGRTVRDFDLDLHAGEIVGVTGLAGMGQDELPYLLSGRRHAAGGSVELGDHAGLPIAVIPANRAAEGVWLDGAASENLTIATLRRHTRGAAILRRSNERAAALEAMRRFRISPALPERRVRQFSGGNQQKIVLARWFSTEARIFLLHEPTQGIDVGAKAEIYALISDAVATGVGVVICSNDWLELSEVCNRVIVLQAGRTVATISGDRLTEAELALVCQGG